MTDARGAADAQAADVQAAEADEGAEASGMSAGAIALLVLATFGGGMAMIVPMAYSLALRIEELAPGRVDLLGAMLAIGSTATLVLAPLTGVLSDRTRSRWGRRRPFTVVGLVIGVASVPVMALAPSPAMLTLGWILSTVGWGTAVGSIGNIQADALAQRQRGRVSGLTSLAMQISPVIGILLIGLVPGRTVLVFAIPAAFGAVTVAAFAVFSPERDSRMRRNAHPLTLRRLLGSYVFDPRQAPDFAWNWLGRFVFFLGLTLTTSFTAFFFAQRLDLEVAEVAPAVALTSLAGLAAALLGALGVGAISDRAGRRRPFILGAAVVFAAGAVLTAFAHDLAMILIGSLISSLGIAAFGAVGQALTLDVIPHRDAEAGRYLAIVAFSQKIPGVLAPLLAPMILLLGDGAPNYTALYLASALLAVAGGVLIAVRVRGVR